MAEEGKNRAYYGDDYKFNTEIFVVNIGTMTLFGGLEAFKNDPAAAKIIDNYKAGKPEAVQEAVQYLNNKVGQGTEPMMKAPEVSGIDNTRSLYMEQFEMLQGAKPTGRSINEQIIDNWNNAEVPVETYKWPVSEVDIPELSQLAKANTQGYTEGAGKTNLSSLDDYINNPKKFSEVTPEQLYKYLQVNGFSPSPLSGGNTKGISFEQGGGFKVNWGGDRILQYHPSGLNHHGGVAYFKVSSGPTGTLHFDLLGNPLPPIRTE